MSSVGVSTSGRAGPKMHYGLTSTDVVDTAYMVRIKKANSLLRICSSTSAA